MNHDFTLIRSRKRKKTISIAVNREGRVIVRAPYGVALAEIEGFVNLKRAWLVQKLAEFKARSGDTSKTPLIVGDGILYLGNVYPVSVNLCALPGKEVLLWNGSAFQLICREPMGGKALLAQWYASQAGAMLPGRVAHYSRIVGVIPSSIRVSSARCRFGSCSAAKRISLSWRLMMAPLTVIDAVIIHELCHLIEMNHSNRFWALVGSFCPGYDHAKSWLKQNGKCLVVF
ncbi:MAG: M48 family metallopeptidase [Syntrophaceae bacterium]|nr:M48 family metallopeptidase [Syntrophaceae bacterium]